MGSILARRPKQVNKFDEALEKIKQLDPIECGSAEMKKRFSFAENYRNLNHGSFGTYPSAIRPIFELSSSESEARPDKYIRYDYPKLLDKARQYVSSHLNAPIETCVLVPNATMAFNVIFRSLIFQPNDVIITFSTAYGACEKTIIYVTEITPAEHRKVEYNYPLSDDALCTAFEATIASIKSQNKTPRIATFDTIVSLPGVRMPFERLTAICRAHNILSCIDGAHSIGHIPIDLQALDPDFYLSNCHKWLYTPRGCCVMYAPVRNQHLIRTSLPTSHYFEPLPVEGGDEGAAGKINNPLPRTAKGRFVMNFEFSATVDNAPFVCVPAAVEWRKKARWGSKEGEAAILGYCVDVAKRGGEIVAKRLGTEVMENEEGTLRQCAFANVRLPLEAGEVLGKDGEGAASKVTLWMSKVFVEEYDTFMAIIFYAGRWWVRLSGQVYLDEKDFAWGGDVLAEVCERVKKGEWKE